MLNVSGDVNDCIASNRVYKRYAKSVFLEKLAECLFFSI